MSETLVLQVRRLTPAAILPTRAHPGDSGLDLYASEDLELGPGEFRAVPTGIAICLPPQTEGQVRPRSGLARSHGVTVLNTPGTVDEGYRGELQVLLINHGKRNFAITAGMRIAQLVIHARLLVDVVETDALPDTARGAGGFGSTGS